MEQTSTLAPVALDYDDVVDCLAEALDQRLGRGAPVYVATDGSLVDMVAAWGVALDGEASYALNLPGEDQSAYRAEVEGLLVVARALNRCRCRGRVHILADCQSALTTVAGGGSNLLLSRRACAVFDALQGKIEVSKWWVPSHGKPAGSTWRCPPCGEMVSRALNAHADRAARGCAGRVSAGSDRQRCARAREVAFGWEKQAHQAFRLELKKKYEHDHEIAALKNALPGEGDPNAAGVAQSNDKMLSVQKNDENRSLKTNRLFPTPNKPDPMPQNLAFLFTKITPDTGAALDDKLGFVPIGRPMEVRWNVLTAIFFTQVLMVIGYCAALACFPDYWWTCTLCFGLPFSYIAIQNIYIDHDVMHGATFPVYEWQRFLTHPFADFFSLPWEEFVLEHNRHHASTVDLLIQGEFGWDPEEFHYALQQWAGPWSSNWYKYLLTVPFIPVIHFFGLNDTGSLFALEWWMHFPDEGAGGKCNKELPGLFWSKWIPRRVKHNAFVLSLWACVWLLGTYPLGRPLSEGWRFMFTVSVFARIGYSAAWMFITNFTHSF
ncbi:hypothetical protein AK812_SmicGene7782 [Symbiodinium microadriaticum]|uniref:Uncharacterized protein n=1 Tax=Symbiodinium microadriaticum TaxID=2951 RepID=A0A1Q9EMK7_SYMMI|nr:hypothetical protein AK812_SmicGene7782 [Symbiodinium microadriaticum]